MANASRDENSVPTLLGVSSSDNTTPIKIYADPTTHRLLVSGGGGGGSGTVTSVSVVPANGFTGTVATATTTPAITIATSVTGLLQGNGTALSAVTIGTGLTFTGGILSATGAVSSVSNADSTLTISPTTGAVVASLNLANANTWTAIQKIFSTTTPQLRLGYDTSNYLDLNVSNNGSTGIGVVGTSAGLTFNAATNGSIALNTNAASTSTTVLFNNNQSSINNPLLAGFFAPNTPTSASAGAGAFFGLGIAATNNNASTIQFNYIGSGSTSNTLSFGMYGTPNFTFFNNSKFGIGSNTLTSLFNVGTAAQFQIDSNGNVAALAKTITATGTNGAQTINKSSGSVNFATGATSLVVTNSLVTANSVILVTIANNDASFTSAQITQTAGSFTIFANAPASGATRVNFLVTN